VNVVRIFYMSHFLESYTRYVSSVGGADTLLRFVGGLATVVREQLPPSDPRRAQLAPLSEAIGGGRAVFRLLGWLKMISSTLKPPTEHDDTLRMVGLLKTYSMLAFFPLDGLSLLASHKVVSGINPLLFGKYACRCWLAFVIFDLLGNLYKLRKLTESGKDDEFTQRQRLRIAISLIGNFADLLEAYTFSVDSKPVGPLAIGLCDTVAASTGLYLDWLSQ